MSYLRAENEGLGGAHGVESEVWSAAVAEAPGCRYPAPGGPVLGGGAGCVKLSYQF
jgi:hypothetical protein